MMRLKNTAGFSFVELMSVIAIIGIMSAIALPYLVSGQPQRRLKAAARDLYSAMQQARLLAVKNNQPVHVCFNTGANFYFLDDVLDNNGDDNRCLPVPTERPERIDLQEIYYDVQFGRGSATTAPVAATGNTTAEFITFRPAGTTAPDSAGNNTVYLQNSNNPSESFAVSVQMSGSVKISWFDGKGNWR